MIPRPDLLCEPPLPPPIHGLNPRTLLGSDWWDQARNKSYASTDYHCAACGVHKSKAIIRQWLEAHELYHINYVLGTAILSEIVPLCHACHNYIHWARLAILVDSDLISKASADQIMAHGDAILKSHGLEKRHLPKMMAPWTDWRLIIEGNSFRSPFPSKKEWETYYSRSR